MRVVPVTVPGMAVRGRGFSIRAAVVPRVVVDVVAAVAVGTHRRSLLRRSGNPAQLWAGCAFVSVSAGPMVAEMGQPARHSQFATLDAPAGASSPAPVTRSR